MPARDRQLASALPHVIGQDQPCVSCGYNLVGLRTDARCPECGRSIKPRKRAARHSDNLVSAPMPWLRTLKLGSTLLLASVLGLLLATILSLFVAGVPTSVVSLVAACLWWAGVLITTRPRPVTAATSVDPRVEWAGLRLASRITQAFWALGLGLSAAAPGPGGVLTWAAPISLLVAIAGLPVLLVLLSNTAFWASDSTLAGHMRACAWSIAIAGFLFLFIALVGSVSPIGGLIGIVLSVALFFFIVIPIFHLAYCLWSFRAIAAWAVLNHVAAEARAERLKDKADRAAAAAELDRARPPAPRNPPKPASTPKPVPPPPTAAGDTYSLEP